MAQALGPKELARYIDHTLLNPEASAQDIERLCAEAREHGFWSVGSKFGVKASGGIRDLRAALAMIEAGATRLGTSSGVVILRELMASASGQG